MNNLAIFIVGLIIILIGVFIIYRSENWIKDLEAWWPWEFGMFEIKFMKIMWRIVSLLFIGFGVYLLVKWR